MKEKNVSKLTKTLAVMSLLAPVTAHPLGIGDIELHSVLNQKLNAVIKLHLAGENPSDISVRLAAPEKFDQAGVPWSYFLSKIKFDPVVSPDGSMVIKVSSKETFVEPFLNFLLEVSWPQGNLIREFTLLIDPPAEYQTPSFPVASNRFDQADLQSDAIERPVKPRTSKSSTRTVRAANAISPQTPTSGEYGPTQSQDTLWRIADGLANKQGVSTAQMMNALYRANPDAFIRGNMDLLKVGAVLRIPETQAILQGSNNQQASRNGIASPGSKPLELVAATESNVEENASIGHSKASATNGSVAAGSANAAASNKDIELQGRVEKLEQQLKMMQQLLELKDQQLANLQNKDKVPAAGTATAPTSVPNQPGLVATQQPGVVSQVPEIAKPAANAQQQPVVAVQATVKPTPVVTQKPIATVVPSASDDGDTTYLLALGAIGVTVLSLVGGLWWRKRKIEERTNSESMFASASQIKMPDSDSALSVPVVDITNVTSYDVGTVGESSFISDFTPSDFDAFDTDQSEVDPLSEADVYLAYGRYQQAEDLIRHAIRDVPERDDYKLKLLEILYANENKEGFSAYAQELSDAGKQADRVFWTKVSDMGKDIVPEFALFGGVDAELDAFSHPASEPSKQSPVTDTASFNIEDEFDSFSHDDDLFDLNDASLPDLALMDDINSELAELELNSGDYSKPKDSRLDFDLSSFSATTDGTKGGTENASIETIDFDLSGLSLDTIKADERPTDTLESTLESFDFNFDLDTADSSADGSTKTAADEATLDMDNLENFDFPEFNSSTKDVTTGSAGDQVAETAAGDDTESVADEFDFNFNFDTPVAQNSEEGELDVFDLTDLDEFETKIDLAKAYIDMGDTEAAKNIAKEVLEKGTKEQQQAAQAILDEL